METLPFNADGSQTSVTCAPDDLRPTTVCSGGVEQQAQHPPRHDTGVGQFPSQADHLPGWSAAVHNRGTSIDMKNIIAAAIAALALASCNEDEAAHIESGNKHLESASADYEAAATSAVARALDEVSVVADKASNSLSK